MINRIEQDVVDWKDGNAKTVTFVVTEDCQLVCGYCYLVGKNTKKKMSFETAKKTIDYLLSQDVKPGDEAIILEFIGGEPCLEIELIDKIADYFKRESFKLDHPWFNNYMISFATNGVLYKNDKVQRFIEKNKMHLSIGISIDGTKEKHDLQRKYKNGKGSYDDIARIIPLWLKQFPTSATKVTISSDDLSLLKDSILHLWSLGINSVHSNVVFEDVWQEGDDAILEEQLTLLADEILDKELYKDYYCSFFQRSIGKPTTTNINWCGAGRMLAIDTIGDFYPCIRFIPFSLTNRPGRKVGNCNEGIDQNKVRPFLALNVKSQSDSKCVDCEVASGCAWCQGVNYDFADSETIYQRATYICKAHKARVRANNYFWDKYDRKMGN